MSKQITCYTAAGGLCIKSPQCFTTLRQMPSVYFASASVALARKMLKRIWIGRKQRPGRPMSDKDISKSFTRYLRHRDFLATTPDGWSKVDDVFLIPASF